ncbi:hypothetical protein CTA1_9770 [Colletotrichum tanaceti]|uniref:Uncharacterized protein n=1 Tax=Colletotrichum tanaceti TaxID=1306861 RepID=A0A4U6X6G3_9PEZI|nr:hypothetical protein CTA1_9770 [Colletotrichum tanaceti]
MRSTPSWLTPHAETVGHISEWAKALPAQPVQLWLEGDPMRCDDFDNPGHDDGRSDRGFGGTVEVTRGLLPL